VTWAFAGFPLVDPTQKQSKARFKQKILKYFLISSIYEGNLEKSRERRAFAPAQSAGQEERKENEQRSYRS
jgi:hypothetical protein